MRSPSHGLRTMPKYVNTRTGAVVETASVCSGEDWEEQKENKPQEKTLRKSSRKTKNAAPNAAEKDVKTDE